jgi:hypothetical protein
MFSRPPTTSLLDDTGRGAWTNVGESKLPEQEWSKKGRGGLASGWKVDGSASGTTVYGSGEELRKQLIWSLSEISKSSAPQLIGEWGEDRVDKKDDGLAGADEHDSESDESYFWRAVSPPSAGFSFGMLPWGGSPNHA